jgi:hypothetical protein
LQTLAGIAVPLVHEGAPQVVDAPGYVQLVDVPSQVAAQGPVPGHEARDPRGFPETTTQVPTVPLSLHASHAPVHARLQQTPSAQKFETQSLSILHATPAATPSL